MKGENIKKYQQKELNLMYKMNIEENKKLNFFLTARRKPRKFNMQN